jgi:hypothetical protein
MYRSTVLAYPIVFKTVSSTESSDTVSNGENNHLPVYHFNVSPGTSWNISSFTQSAEGSSLTVSQEGLYTGLETVQVPAGTFQNCARFDITFTQITSYGEMSYTQESGMSVWFAPDTGIVKIRKGQIAEGDFIETMSDVLTDYSAP